MQEGKPGVSGVEWPVWRQNYNRLGFPLGSVPELKRPTRCYLFTILTSDVVRFTWRIRRLRREDVDQRNASTTKLVLLLFSSIKTFAGCEKKNPVADIGLVAPAEGAIRRAKMSAVTREVFSSLARRCSSPPSRGLHGSAATVAGERPRHPIAAMNYRPIKERHFLQILQPPAR